MGEYYLYANKAKCEFLHPGHIGEGCKHYNLLWGRSATALGLLLCRGFHCHALCGSWSGDEVLVTGDQQHWHPAIGGGKDTLYDQALREFLDVSYRTVAMLCLFREELAPEFVERAKSNKDLFMGLLEMIFEEGCPPLERAFFADLGAGWQNWHARKKRK